MLRNNALRRAAAACRMPNTAAPISAMPEKRRVLPTAVQVSLSTKMRHALPACTACHSIAPGVIMAGPTLAGLVARTSTLLSSPDYKGKATDVEAYIREAVVSPSAHMVPGAMYSANGQSFMPNTYGKDLTPDQINQLVAYLTSLK